MRNIYQSTHYLLISFSWLSLTWVARFAERDGIILLTSGVTKTLPL